MGIKFDEKELKVLEISPAFRDAEIPVFDFPMSMKDEWIQMALKKKPVWMNTGVECFSFYPDIIPDNRARGFVNDGGVRLTDAEKGGKDMFGIEWVYVPVAGGSMEKPGAPHPFDDANDWEDVIKWPDIDSWDWKGCAERNKKFLDNGKFNNMPLLNGFGFERLISFMGFENAAVALVDEEQEDALKALLNKLSDLYCDIIDRACDYFAIDGFLVHDDWGGQRSPFFSFDAGEDFLVPNMKKVTDRIHSHGKVAELHSCGCNEKQIENFIAGGWDIWGPMANINDTKKLFHEYGDRIILGVEPYNYDKENATEEDIRQSARDFVNEFCSDPNKVCIVNRYFSPYLQGIYAEELYKASRIMLQDR
ncbi:MAG: methyltransferase [Lachnospiraceae bacterium]|nr:methyltransferase [Lachnospiraceae bacterium]